MIQNRFYNGWTHEHYVSNITVFVPNDRVIACALNALGSFHDSTVAEYGDLYTELEKVFNKTGSKYIIDSAFWSSRYPFLVKSGSDSSATTADAFEFVTEKQATSARQAAEWGMRALQGSFPRLKERPVFENRGERQIILISIV